MLAHARQILVSELTFALNVDEETAESRLDDVLAGKEVPVTRRRRAPASNGKKATTRKAPARKAAAGRTATPKKAAARRK